MEVFKKSQFTEKSLVADDAGWKGLGPAMAFAVFGVLVLLVLSYRPAETGAGVGMVFPFSLSEEEILLQVGAAGGRVARFGGFGHMAVVVRDDGVVPQAADFGAIFSLSPLVLSACFDADETKNAF